MPKVTTYKRDAQITIRIPSWLRHEIELAAERDRRTIADIMVYALEERKWCKHLLKKPGEPCTACQREAK